jgi:hypothetical protein
MRVALLQLGEDFLSNFVFLGIYLAIGNLPLAVGFALAIGIGQLALAKWRRRRLNDAVAEPRTGDHARRRHPHHQ